MTGNFIAADTRPARRGISPAESSSSHALTGLTCRSRAQLAPGADGRRGRAGRRGSKRGGHARMLRDHSCATLTELETGLDPGRFVRIHRGTLVRLDQVREVIPASHGDYDLVLREGDVLKLSRRYRSRLLP